MEILKFDPIFKSVIWGGKRIAEFKGLPSQGDHIGESWELSPMEGHESVVSQGTFKGATLPSLIANHGNEIMGERLMKKYDGKFPLLIKLIDSSDDLSVQVHPDDELAAKRHNSLGKTEMWYSIAPAEGAYLYAGFSKHIDAAEFRRQVAENEIIPSLHKYFTHPGDIFFLPAGRVHSIGRGNFVLEIQEASDITYRIYDYDRRDKDGNPRELHTEQAKDAIDYTVYPDYQSHPEGSLLAECEYFDTRILNLNGDTQPIANPRGSFTIVICLAGEAEIINNANGEVFTIKRGDTLLFPAVMTSLSARGTATLLTVQS